MSKYRCWLIGVGEAGRAVLTPFKVDIGHHGDTI
jgi:hypothetical protein